jgi:hypothetical protein
MAPAARQPSPTKVAPSAKAVAEFFRAIDGRPAPKPTPTKAIMLNKAMVNVVDDAADRER